MIHLDASSTCKSVVIVQVKFYLFLVLNENVNFYECQDYYVFCVRLRVFSLYKLIVYHCYC